MDRGYGSACGFRVWIGALHFDSQQTLSFVPARSRRARRHAGMQARNAHRHAGTHSNCRQTNEQKQTNKQNNTIQNKTNKQQTNKHTNQQTHKPTNTQTDKRTNGQTDRQTNTRAKPKNKCGPSFGTRAIMALLERRDALLNGKGDWELKAGRGRNPLSLVPNAGGHSYMSCCLRAKTQCALPHCHTHWRTHTRQEWIII